MATFRSVRHLLAAIGSLPLAGPVHAGWEHYWIDPPDDTALLTNLPRGFTVSETHEGYARARA
jgi:hypothetical protein